MAQAVELWRERPESDCCRHRSAFEAFGCIGEDVPEDGLEHAVGEAGVAYFGRRRQQGLDDADPRRLDEVDGLLLAEPEPPGDRNPVNPRLQHPPAYERRGGVQHSVRIAQETEQGRVGDAEVDLCLPPGAQLVQRIDAARRRRGDYADPESLQAAFAGADQLLLVSSSDPGADAVGLHRAAIDAAVTAGVGRILYTSHQGAAPDTPFGPGRDGPTTLTANAAASFEVIAETAAELTGHPIAFEVIDPEAWVAAQIAIGRPEFVARFTLGMYQAAEEGFFAGVDPLLGTLLGREPQTVRDVLSRPTGH